MNSEFTEEARKDLFALNKRQQTAIKRKVKEIEKDPTGHEESKIIRIGSRSIYRVKVKEERDAEIDHRIIYDLRDDKIIIYSIINRNQGYDKEDLKDKIRGS